MLSVVVGWLALVFAPAFAQDDDPGASPSLSAVPAASADPPAPPDLRGDWRFELVVVSHASVPILGTTVVESRTVFRTTVSGTVEQPMIDAVACSIHVEPSRAIAKTIVPQPFVDAIPPKHVPVRLTWTDGAWRFHADMQAQPLGYDPSVTGQALPQDADDPGITDLEGDGFPGGTIHLDAPLFGEIDLYVVQNAHTVLDGVWTGTDTWEGGATVRPFGQRTIGASNRLFVANADIQVDQASSRFRWSRVPTGTSCAGLRKGVGGS